MKPKEQPRLFACVIHKPCYCKAFFGNLKCFALFCRWSARRGSHYF